MNHVVLTGRLTRDPESRKLASGKTVTEFSVATNDYRGGSEKAEYHPVVTWVARPVDRTPPARSVELDAVSDLHDVRLVLSVLFLGGALLDSLLRLHFGDEPIDLWQDETECDQVVRLHLFHRCAIEYDRVSRHMRDPSSMHARPLWRVVPYLWKYA